MNKWDEKYDRSDYFYGTEPNTFLAENGALFRPGQKILCLGEGEGRNSVFLASLGCRVTAVDLSKVGLAKAEKMARQKNLSVEFICQDLSHYDFGDQVWDGIVSIWLHLPSEVRHRVHRLAARGLKPAGIFLLEAYTPEQLKFKTGGPSDPDLMPRARDLEQDFEGLEILHLKECERPIVEGVGHVGLSSVVQLIAQRSGQGQS
jgi:SAM-dependent methyltransferase